MTLVSGPTEVIKLTKGDISIVLMGDNHEGMEGACEKDSLSLRKYIDNHLKQGGIDLSIEVPLWENYNEPASGKSLFNKIIKDPQIPKSPLIVLINYLSKNGCLLPNKETCKYEKSRVHMIDLRRSTARDSPNILKILNLQKGLKFVKIPKKELKFKKIMNDLKKIPHEHSKLKKYLLKIKPDTRKAILEWYNKYFNNIENLYTEYWDNYINFIKDKKIRKIRDNYLDKNLKDGSIQHLRNNGVLNVNLIEAINEALYLNTLNNLNGLNLLLTLIVQDIYNITRILSKNYKKNIICVGFFHLHNIQNLLENHLGYKIERYPQQKYRCVKLPTNLFI
jgi:hypothetical protein